MAGNRGSYNIPGSARRQYGDEGSSVDPEKYRRHESKPQSNRTDNITGKPLSTSRTVSPSGIGFNISQTHEKDRARLPVLSKNDVSRLNINKGWSNRNFLYNMMVPNVVSFTLTLNEFKTNWKYMLKMNDNVKLIGWIRMVVDQNITIYTNVIRMINRREIKSVFEHLYMPGTDTIKPKWEYKISFERNHVTGLRRLLEILMILQLQLDEAVSDLENLSNHRPLVVFNGMVWHAIKPGLTTPLDLFCQAPVQSLDNKTIVLIYTYLLQSSKEEDEKRKLTTAECRVVSAATDSFNVAVQGKVIQLQSEKSLLEQNIVSLKRNDDVLQFKITQLQSEKSLLQQKITNLERETSESRDIIAELESDKNVLQKNVQMISRSKQDLEDNLKRETSVSQDIIAKLESDKNVLQKNVQILARSKQDLENKLKRVDMSQENQTLRTQFSTLKVEYDSLRRSKEEQEETMKSNMEHIDTLNGKNSKREKALVLFKSKIDELETTLREKTSKMSTIDQTNFELQNKNKVLESEKESLQQQLNECSRNRGYFYSEWEKSKNEMQSLTERFNNEYQNLQRQLTTKSNLIENKTLEISKLFQQNNVLQKSKEELLTRLSKVAGAKLTHDNSDITDLSDEHRPTKLAERFGELYDNEWTDALEELTSNGMGEREAVDLNLDIISRAYAFCGKVLQLHSDTVRKSLACLPMLDDENESQTVNQMCHEAAHIPTEVLKDLEDIRRTLTPQLITEATSRFLNHIEPTIKHRLKGPDGEVTVTAKAESYDNTGLKYSDWKGDTSSDTSQGDNNTLMKDECADRLIFQMLPATKDFTEKCAALCWYMSIQNVHMVCEVKRGIDFNTDIFRQYTRTGKQIDYLVWPVIYLRENGPVLTKGVAQPMK